MKHAETSALVAAIRGPFWIWLVSSCHSWLHTVQMRSDLTLAEAHGYWRSKFVGVGSSTSSSAAPASKGSQILKARLSDIHGISMAFPWHLKIFGYICMQSPYYVAFFWNSFCRWWCNFCCNAESKTLFSIGGRPIRIMWRANGGNKEGLVTSWHGHGISMAFP